MIALYGGSFNPVHIGHLSMVLQAKLQPSVTVDTVKVVPCFRQEGKSLVEFEHRINMARLAFADLPYVHVDPIESRLGGESYTYRMVEAVLEASPSEQFILILGEDLRDKVAYWKHPERITIPKLFFHRSSVSSTVIRQGLKAGARVEEAVVGVIPKSVRNYIKEHGLYR